MGRGSAGLVALYACALLGACWSDPGTGSLELLDFRQNELASVALNEDLAFHFSAELDPSSVTADSVRIEDDEGREVAGERIVQHGNSLVFQAELSRSSDLLDGGLRPGRGYRVVLGGFPRPDGLRSEAGAVLAATLQLSFHTAEIGGTSPLFVNPFLDPTPLTLRGKQGANFITLDDGRIVLEAKEALDPASVRACRFELKFFAPGSKTPEVLPVSARLTVNRRDHAELLLEATPFGQVLPRGDYYLGMPGRDLLTLGGRAIEPRWPLSWPLRVPEQRIELTEREGSHDPAPNCDGTAFWSGDLLTVRYPAAAGDGAGGELELAQRPAAADTRGTHVLLPAGVEVDLGPAVGPIVIRSQTALEIRGRLVRRGLPTSKDPLASELEGALTPGNRRDPFSAWVERLLMPEQTQQPWTVLIAGGDLLVPKGGVIDVDGPLVLVAGGFIRVDGRVYSHDSVWYTSEMRGNVSAHGSRRVLPLELDAPHVNPLRVPLTLGVLTRPLLGDWRSVTVSRAGAGTVTTELLLVEALATPGGAAPESATDPARAAPAGFRILVRLALGTGHGEAWDPPRVEHLALENLLGSVPSGAPR